MIETKRENGQTEVLVAGKAIEILDESDGDIVAECTLEDLTSEAAHPLPKELRIEVHSEDGFGTFLFHELIISAHNSDVSLEFRCHTPNKHWEGRYGLATFIKAMSDQLPYQNGLTLTNIELDDDWKGITLQRVIASGDSLLSSVTNAAADLNSLIHQAEVALSGLSWRDEFKSNEDAFCRELLYPLLQRMGFLFVRYSHGKKEYGKDFTFSEITPFGSHRHYGLQAKAGDISGGVNAAVDELLGQLNDAFSMPYFELGSKDQRYISTFIIAISGSFTENAREKIVEKMPKGCVGSVYFLDRERINELVQRYWKSGKA